MYCPRCGQQQVSDQTKFCSRCGFQLSLVGELLIHGGFLPELADVYRKKKFLNKKNGVVLSFFWFMFFLFIMTPVWGILDVEVLAAASAVIGIFGSIMMLTASLVFLPKSTVSIELPVREVQHGGPAGLYGNQSQNALPPEQSIPASNYMAPQGEWRAPDTGDLARPGSVTEGTTKLLRKNE